MVLFDGAAFLHGRGDELCDALYVADADFAIGEMIPDGAHAAAVVVGRDGRRAPRGEPFVPFRIFFPGDGFDVFIASQKLDHPQTGVAIVARGGRPYGGFGRSVDD